MLFVDTVEFSYNEWGGGGKKFIYIVDIHYRCEDSLCQYFITEVSILELKGEISVPRNDFAIGRICYNCVRYYQTLLYCHPKFLRCLQLFCIW